MAVAGVLATTMEVDVPMTTYGWPFGTLLSTSVLAGGAPTAAEGFVKGLYVSVVLTAAGVLVSLALAPVSVVPPVVVDEEACREEAGAS